MPTTRRHPGGRAASRFLRSALSKFGTWNGALSLGWPRLLRRGHGDQVACFLTRGDLWQNWTAGRDVFKRLLLDEDWALNNGNWLWLAGVAPFSMPYFRIYDPCPGPKSRS